MKKTSKTISILLCMMILLGIITAVPASFSAADSNVITAEEPTENIPEIRFDVSQTEPITEPWEETVIEEPLQAQTEAETEEQSEPGNNKIIITEDTGEKAPLPDDINKTVVRSKSGEGEGSNLSSDEPEFVEGEAIVMLDDADAVNEIKDDVDVESTVTLEGSDSELNLAVVSDENRSTEELIEDLSEQDGVESVIPNYISHCTAITNDPYSQYQWALNNTGQNGGTWGVDIDPGTAWSKASARKKSCVVAVLDTGVSPSNNDLKSVLWKNTYHALPGYGYCGYDFTGAVKNHAPKDDTGHGSHVAGIIAAAGNNKSGISGVNRSGVKIMALKVFSNGKSKLSNELKAFQYIIKAKKLGVNIRAVNCSYSGLGNLAARKEYDKIFNTLGSLGIVTCVSAGNEDANIEYKSKGYYRLPASCQSKYCLTVAATDENGRITSYSNYSSKYVDIAAPGNDILSTVNYGRFLPSAYSASNISKLCSYYQSYDANSSGSFGYDIRDGYDTNGNKFSSPGSFTITSSEYSGTSGKSLAVRLTNAYNRNYAFELPYYLSSTTGNYSVSALVKCRDGDVTVGMYDIPSYYNYDDGPIASYKLDETWTTFNLDIKPNSTKYYRKATSRRLGFVIVCRSSSATIYFDHIAVSKQNIDPTKFGKLDYMSGTSMATPYVSGAAALIANGFPELKAIDVVNAIKNSAIKSGKLASFVNNGRFLNLKNITKYAKVSYPLSTPKITKLRNTGKGVRITIGKVKGAVRYRVFYNNGKKWINLGDTKTTTFTHKGVRSGKKYRYAVRCVSKDGKKLQSDFNHTGWAITYVAAPKPPKLKNTSKGVQITFSRVSGATKYRIFRKKGNGSWVKLVDTKKTTYTDKTAKKGVTYRYTIRCLSSKGKFISSYNNGSAITRSR